MKLPLEDLGLTASRKRKRSIVEIQAINSAPAKPGREQLPAPVTSTDSGSEITIRYPAASAVRQPLAPVGDRSSAHGEAQLQVPRLTAKTAVSTRRRSLFHPSVVFSPL